MFVNTEFSFNHHEEDEAEGGLHYDHQSEGKLVLQTVSNGVIKTMPRNADAVDYLLLRQLR